MSLEVDLENSDIGIESDTSDIEVVEIQENEEEPSEETSKPPSKSVNPLKALRCPICLETPEIVAVAPCGHPYCHECIFTALSSARGANRKEGECSLCRKRVRYDQIIYMEFKTGKRKKTTTTTTTNSTPPPSDEDSSEDSAKKRTHSDEEEEKLEKLEKELGDELEEKRPTKRRRTEDLSEERLFVSSQ